MKTYVQRILWGFCLVLGLASVAAAASPAAPASDEAAIAQFMNKDMAAAWKENSPGKVLELFSESMPVVWLNDGKKAVVSKAERKKELEAFFNKVKVMDFTLGDVVVTKINNKLGFVTCTQKLLVVDKATKQENELVMRNIYEVVKEKNGKWHAYREISFVGDAGN